MQGVFHLLAGMNLTILVGTSGFSALFGGGGGGSFVGLGSSYMVATPLIVAGGGGGSTSPSSGSADAQITQLPLGTYLANASFGGPPSPCGGSGGGFYSNGGNDTLYSFSGGAGFRQGGAGASCSQTNFCSQTAVGTYGDGGFGGGGLADFLGACNALGGPGGGYTGAGGVDTYYSLFYGYGGGSYNGGVNQCNLRGIGAGNGNVMIYKGPLHFITSKKYFLFSISTYLLFIKCFAITFLSKIDLCTYILSFFCSYL